MKINFEAEQGNNKYTDLSIAGPGSPVSLKKFLHNTELEGGLKKLNLLVDGSSTGIAKDSEDLIYCTPETRRDQTLWWLKNKFKEPQIPAYLYRYMHQIFCDEKVKYKVDTDVLSVNIEDLDYKRILNLIKYAEQNTEACQTIGLIMQIAGTLSLCKKHGKSVRLFIELIEHGMHPGTQSKVMSWLVGILKEYE